MRAIILAMATAVAATGAAAQPAASARDASPSQPLPQSVTRVFDCRALVSAADRLACFDREVAALETAARARDIAVYDREQVRKTRRSLFGIALPDLNIFGGGRDDEDGEEEGLAQIESTIRALRQDQEGRYILTLADGARWAQIDRKELSAYPKVGQPIRIRRAAMGSYLANIGGNTAVRVRRILP